MVHCLAVPPLLYTPMDSLRIQDCRANLFHIIPSRAMKADALAQYLTFKRWQRWVLASGTGEGDKAFAEAMRAAPPSASATRSSTNAALPIPRARAAPIPASSRSRSR